MKWADDRIKMPTVPISYPPITFANPMKNIVTLQKRKNQLVKISLDACAGDQAQQGLEVLANSL